MDDGNQLNVKLLGAPVVLLDNSLLSLPYRQTEALFYYLLVNKRATKSGLADLIWGDVCGEEKSTSNLRNAFYVLRKYLGKDFISKGSGEQISIGKTVRLDVDVDRFLSGSAPVTLYTGDFLEGFYLKNNTLYNEWIENTRQYLKNLYLKKLHAAILTEFDGENLDRCEELCHKQLQINEFDETAYQYLMKIYQKRQNYSMALKLYHQLEKLFDQELFEKPGKETQKLASSIEDALNREISTLLKNKKELGDPSSERDIFYGRNEELLRLQDTFSSFIEELPFKHILLSGEAGIGKTALAEHFLDWCQNKQQDTSSILLLKMRCYYAEEKYILKPWQSAARRLLDFLNANGEAEENRYLVQGITGLFPFLDMDSAVALDADDISTLDYKSIQSIFVNSLLRFSTKHRLLIFIDDVQWTDEISLSLIRDIITSACCLEGCRLFLLMTARNNPGTEPGRFFDNMYALNLLDIIPLKRFNFQDTVSLASQLLPDYHFTPAARQQLFRETEGNLLFIREAVHHIKYNGSPDDITPNMRNIIEQRIAPLSEECCQLLNLASIFFDGISFKCLSALSHKEDYVLADLLEALLQQNLLKEDTDEDDTYFSFTHQKFYEYVYERMSWTKKRILHNKAGLFYEGRLKNNLSDLALYPKLIYHFDKSSNYQKYLKYTVKYLYHYLNVTHEFFPVIEQNLTFFPTDLREKAMDSPSNAVGSIEALLRSVENRVHDQVDTFLTDEADRNEQLEIVSDYLHMTGRHYIRSCNYAEGQRYIQKLKEINEIYDSPIRLTKLLQANRQLICIYINRYEPEQMNLVILDSLRLLAGASLPEEVAVWKRLQGLYCIMSGRQDEGIGHLETAIDLFTRSKDREKHLYNLAASYSWIGEACRQAFEYEKALSYYDQAIEICSRNSLSSGISIFYAYAGMAAYDSGRLPLAEKHLLESIGHYERGNLMWGRSLPYSYYCLVLLKKKEYGKALESLKNAGLYASKLESRYELGIVYRICAQIRSGMFDGETAKENVSRKMENDFEAYYDRAAGLLDGVYSPIDRQYLAQMARI